jgi:hypothetical protein
VIGAVNVPHGGLVFRVHCDLDSRLIINRERGKERYVCVIAKYVEETLHPYLNNFTLVHLSASGHLSASVRVLGRNGREDMKACNEPGHRRGSLTGGQLSGRLRRRFRGWIRS